MIIIDGPDGSGKSTLVDYIKKNLDKGYKIADLKWALVQQGHSKLEVEKAVKEVNDLIALQKPKKEEPHPEALQKPEPIFEEKKGFFNVFGR